jgi:hypothetical protein
MILRRVIDHFKKQEWTVIGLDLVIVVMGVFIGIQLGNWNDARVERAQAAIFTRALENDLRADAALYRGVADYYSTVRENGLRVLAALQGETTLSDADLVISAYRASQVALTPVNRSTFDELVSTGRINLITDMALRKAATQHFGFSFIAAADADGRQSDYRRLFRGTIPPDAHRAARAQCGDVKSKGFASLDYPCSLGLPAAAVSRAADTLRADTALPAALRRRVNELDVQITDLQREARESEAPAGRE